jgi:hypothetical protein
MKPKKQLSSLPPELIIGTEAAIDRMRDIASRAMELRKPNYRQQIQLVRKEARNLCPAYRNCRVEDWCTACASGQEATPLFLGSLCLGCKLLVVDGKERAKESKLVQIQSLSVSEHNQSQS